MVAEWNLALESRYLKRLVNSLKSDGFDLSTKGKESITSGSFYETKIVLYS